MNRSTEEMATHDEQLLLDEATDCDEVNIDIGTQCHASEDQDSDDSVTDEPALASEQVPVDVATSITTRAVRRSLRVLGKEPGQQATAKERVTIHPTASSDQSTQTLHMPPIAPDGFTSVMMKVPPMPLGLNFHKNVFIVNEVLCYVQNKMDTLPTRSIAKLASDYFGCEDIKNAKQVLFELVHVDGLRKKTHRGEKKVYNDVIDMITLLHAAEIVDVPIFLARNIDSLPPMATDSYDMSALLSKIELMQTSIAALTSAQKDIAETITVKLAASTSHRPATPATTAATNDQPTLEEHTDDSSLSHVSNSSDEEDDSTYATVLKANAQTARHAQFNTVKPRIFRNSRRSTDVSGRQPTSDQNVSNRAHDRDLLTNRNVENTINGRGYAPGLRAVSRSNQHTYSSRAPNRICTGLFVTRLLPNTTTKNVNDHVRKELALTVNAEKIPTKYDSYSSFYIRCNVDVRSALLDAELWPTGALIKPYYS